MRNLKHSFSLIAALLLIGCSQDDSAFRLGLFWGPEGMEDSSQPDADMISADDLVKVDVKRRLALTRRNEALGLKPIRDVTEIASFEYYWIPPGARWEYDGKVNFGYVWIKPIDSKIENWTNTQLWVKSSELANGENLCHNIGADAPWTFFLSQGPCDSRKFDICDDSIPKLGLIYSQHYDIVLMSSTAKSLAICNG